MKIVLAPDAFKGSLSAAEACTAMREGVLRACGSAEVVSCPMADGGEGTAAALVAATGGRMVGVSAMGPLPDEGNVIGQFGLLGDGRSAVCCSGAALQADACSDRTSSRSPL